MNPKSLQGLNRSQALILVQLRELGSVPKDAPRHRTLRALRERGLVSDGKDVPTLTEQGHALAERIIADLDFEAHIRRRDEYLRLFETVIDARFDEAYLNAVPENLALWKADGELAELEVHVRLLLKQVTAAREAKKREEYR